MIDEIQPFMNDTDGDEYHKQPKCPLQTQREPMVIRREEIVQDEKTDIRYGSFDQILLGKDRHENGQNHFQTWYHTEEGFVLHANQWFIPPDLVDTNERNEYRVLHRSECEDALMEDISLLVVVEKIDDVTSDLGHISERMICRCSVLSLRSTLTLKIQIVIW